MRIWTDDECIEVDPDNVGELETAMRFKAEHIKAKADPELFTAVSDAMKQLWDTAARRADVVRCQECKYSSYDEIFGNLWCNSHSGCRKVKDDDFCSYGERKEGADNG